MNWKRMYVASYLGWVTVLLWVGAAVAPAAERAATFRQTNAAQDVQEVEQYQAERPVRDFVGGVWDMVNGYPGEQIGPWFAGAEYRLIRAHFSEALAFAEVNDSFGPGGFERRVQAQELSFNYDNSVRFYLGAHLGDFQDIRLAYWHFDTDVAVNGTAGPGQTLVDPFGNVAVTGETMSTRASVKLNVVDLEFLQTLSYPGPGVDFVYSAGLRFADVDQAYDALARNGAGNVTSLGVFAANFSGVGPYLSLTGSTSRSERSFSLFANGGGAVLIGVYDVSSGFTLPGLVFGEQTARRVMAVPIMEAELGASWHPSERLVISAGWLFQAWFNLGTSGGGFSGENLPFLPVPTVFGQKDDADVMSFDGLFIRGEYRF